jgi:hypothetical protein
LVICQVAAKIWIQTFQTSLAYISKYSPPKWCPSSIIVLEKIAEKQYLLRPFLDIFGYNTFVKIYLIFTDILSVINSRESGFSRILKSEGAIGFQRHLWSNQKRGMKMDLEPRLSVYMTRCLIMQCIFNKSKSGPPGFLLLLIPIFIFLNPNLRAHVPSYHQARLSISRTM